MSVWRRFINWLLRPDPVEIRVTFEPQVIEIQLVVGQASPTATYQPLPEPVWDELAPEEGPAPDPEPEPEPELEVPVQPVRPMGAQPVAQATAEAVLAVVAPQPVARSAPPRQVKPAAIRAFGARSM